MQNITIFKVRYNAKKDNISVSYLNEGRNKTLMISPTDSGNIVRDAIEWLIKTKKVTVIGTSQDFDYYYIVTTFIPFEQFK